MENRKNILLAAVFIVGLASLAEAVSSRKPSGLSVIVAPANYTVLQVAFDIADHYPALIVSYEDDGNAADPFMHVWNGTSWRRLTIEGYSSGDFLGPRPSQVLVVGDDNALSETLLAQSEGWGSQAYILPKAPLRDLMNQLGQRFRFGKRDWTYFAERYKLSVIDLNAAKRDASWYDGKMLKEGSKGAADPAAVPADDPPTLGTNGEQKLLPPAVNSVTSLEVPEVVQPVAVQATTVDASLPPVRFSTKTDEAKATPPIDAVPGLEDGEKEAIKADLIK
jgi:hypothetical protein